MHLSLCWPRGWQMVLLAGGLPAASWGWHHCAPCLAVCTRPPCLGSAACQVILALEGSCI